MIRRLCIVGVGLIGGSLARDLRRLGLCDEVVGTSRRAGHLQRALDLGVIDRYDTDIAAAVDGADMIVIAVPLGAVRPVLEAMAGHLADDAVVTDVGSSKGSVIRAAAEAFGEVPGWFVPGHPIAGTEHSGVEASLEGLFDQRRVILTPCGSTAPAAYARVEAMWRAVGAHVLEMDPAHHDRVLAATSHLPHMLAYTLVDTLGRQSDRVEMFKYAAGGFRDFTRIASSDPQMWHDVCIANGEALVDAIERFVSELGTVTEAIRRGDGALLYESFARAKRLRDEYVTAATPGNEAPVDE